MARVRLEGNVAWRRMWAETKGFFWALVGMLIAVCDLAKFLLEKCRRISVEDDVEYFDVGPEWTPPSSSMPVDFYVESDHGLPLRTSGVERRVSKWEDEAPALPLRSRTIEDGASKREEEEYAGPLQTRGMETRGSKREEEVHEALNVPPGKCKFLRVNTRTSLVPSDIVSVKSEAVWCADCNHPGPAYSSIDFPYNCKGRSNSRHKWYAVAIGKVGPGLFVTWEETQWQVCGFSGQMHKSFPTELAASEYLGASLSAIGYNGDSPHRQNVKFVGRDKFGHVVGRCICCDEIFCDNAA